jgi:hypothetical protein
MKKTEWVNRNRIAFNLDENRLVWGAYEYPYSEKIGII